MGVLLDVVGLMAGLMMLMVALIVTGWFIAASMGRGSWRGLAITCTIIQIGHLAEHALQLGAWFQAPTSMPWMSPIAFISERGLAIIGRHPGNMAVGMEMLHFIGNWIFLIGLAAWAGQFANKWLTFALRLQFLHVLEHVLLVASIFITGHPIGLSTLFGYAVPLFGTEIANGYRVWFHFTANLIATGAVMKALLESKHEIPIRERELEHLRG